MSVSVSVSVSVLWNSSLNKSSFWTSKDVGLCEAMYSSVLKEILINVELKNVKKII